jgi:hypothetical protein
MRELKELRRKYLERPAICVDCGAPICRRNCASLGSRPMTDNRDRRCMCAVAGNKLETEPFQMTEAGTLLFLLVSPVVRHRSDSEVDHVAKE